ncbi:MAG: DUF6514 family protein [Clostridia bacterium]|nr:DUF6514 family protein [Clostridia bacterium]
MYNSRTYYGSIFLGEEDLKETNISYKVKLEYYRIKSYINKETKEIANYGIEIVKKEYRENKVNTETSNKEYITNNPNEVNKIIEKLRKHKVTPIGLNDVLEDLQENGLNPVFFSSN